MPQTASHLVAVAARRRARCCTSSPDWRLPSDPGGLSRLAAAAAIVGLALKVLFFNPWLTLGDPPRCRSAERRAAELAGQPHLTRFPTSRW